MQTLFVISTASAVILFLLISADGKKAGAGNLDPGAGYPTKNGGHCITPCEKRGQNYTWCYTKEKSRAFTHGDWDYCSVKSKRATRAVTDKSCGVYKHKSNTGANCISDCVPTKNERKDMCYTVPPQKKRMLCSGELGYSSRGMKCLSDCAIYSGRLYTCQVGKKTWQACGPVEMSSDASCKSKGGGGGGGGGAKGKDPPPTGSGNGKKPETGKGNGKKPENGNGEKPETGTKSPIVSQHKTTEGKACASECSKGNSTNYYWCYTSSSRTDWDFCSEKPGYGKEGKKCKDACDFHEGKDYTWCHLEGGGWDKCGVRSVSSEEEYTFLESKCVTLCQLNSTGTGNECQDASNQARGCSQLANYTVDNKKCTTPCDLRGGVPTNKESAYFWCGTKGGAWGYCSNSRRVDVPRENGDDLSKEEIPFAQTATGSHDNIFWYQVDQGTDYVTFLERLTENSGFNSVEGFEKLQLWLHTLLVRWREGNYTLPGDNVDTTWRLGKKEEQESALLEQTKRYQWKGVWYRQFQVLVSGNENTVATVRCSESVAKRKPEVLSKALLESAYQGKIVHACRYSHPQ